MKKFDYIGYDDLKEGKTLLKTNKTTKLLEVEKVFDRDEMMEIAPDIHSTPPRILAKDEDDNIYRISLKHIYYITDEI